MSTNDTFPDTGHLTRAERLELAEALERTVTATPETSPALAARIEGYVMGIRHGVAPEPEGAEAPELP